MNEEKFNLSLRSFLKKVGVTSQREIERAVREALESGALAGGETLKASVTLAIDNVDLETRIEGAIELE